MQMLLSSKDTRTPLGLYLFACVRFLERLKAGT